MLYSLPICKSHGKPHDELLNMTAQAALFTIPRKRPHACHSDASGSKPG